ncbi:legume-like lectin family-domain-containing protein, partial [Butyriboletus roseoflavus]
MNIFRLLGDLAHLASIFILVHKIQTTRSCRGISFKTQALYVLVFLTRYIDLFFRWISLYNFFMKVFFIASSCYILYLMKSRFRPTHDPSIDTFKIEYLLGPCLFLALIFNYNFSLTEIMWAFSIYLEAVAIFPQLFMLQRTGEAETITLHYLAALGIYRTLYIPNWIYRYFTEDLVDPIAVVAGLVQTGLYLDFFYVYVTNTLPYAYAAADTKVANRTIERTVQLRTHTIHPPYIDEDLQNRWWDFGADAYINTNKHIRLTRAVPSQMGWLWSRLPLSSSNFVIEIEFKISGASSHLYGDGMAIWLTAERAQPGPVFGNKDKFEGLGLFIDTYANSRHAFGFPRITGMLGDGKTAYDHENDGDANSIGSCSAMVRRTNVITKLRITYVKDSYLDVKAHYRAWDNWSDCFHVDGISLPASPFLGVSALTGQVFDAHDVISITTHSAMLSSQDAPLNKLSTGSGFFGSHRTGGSHQSSWLALFVKFLFLVGVAAGAAYGYKAYKLRSRRGGLSSAGTLGGLGMGFEDRSYGSRRRF